MPSSGLGSTNLENSWAYDLRISLDPNTTVLGGHDYVIMATEGYTATGGLGSSGLALLTCSRGR